MRPMIAREVREADGTVVRRFRPEAVPRVFSTSTTDALREMLTSVVDSGTARSARVEGLAVAGKTGTTKKYDAAAGRYGRVYLSSFAGFAPAEEPTVVGVVVIDEPRGRRYYGGEVAAPVFGRVLEDVRALPQGPLASAASVVAMRPPAPAPVVVPDLRLLPPRAAERTLAAHALRPRIRGEGARVLAQSPPAGTAVERGARVEIWLSAAGDPEGNALPDLTGLAVREALRRLGLRQVQARIVGRGTVVRQVPAAGTVLPLEGPCVLYCEPRLPAAAAPAGEVAALAGTGP
jgi:stage V sporulation protein D (sporulation-specific penicillin-binding protein)